MKLALNAQIIETKFGKAEVLFEDRQKPILLSIHGGLGGFDQARVAIDFAKDQFSLLSISRPGYLNTPLSSGKTIEEQSEFFIAVLDALKIDKVSLFAMSAGGPIAYTLAMNYPQRIHSLVAADCVSGYYDIPETVGYIGELVFLSDIGQSILQKITSIKPEAFIKEIFKTEAYFTKAQTQKHLDFVMNDLKAKEFIELFMQTMYPYNKRKEGTLNDIENTKKLTHLPLHLISIPALIVHGTHDADVKFYDGVYAYENIPNAKKIWVEEGSHVCFWIHPTYKEIQEKTMAFLLSHL